MNRAQEARGESETTTRVRVADADTRDHAPAVRPVRFVTLLVGLLSLPLLVAIVALHSPRWYPLLDWAQTEMRVRDVTTSHPPLIGLAGRIGPYGIDGGSHPGPLSFYALWPTWMLLGRSAFGLQAATVVLDIAAIALVLWMAYRRGGVAMVLSLAAIMAVLLRAYGAFMLTSPWNPYLPPLWWFVFLIAAWSVLDDDFAMLPVAVFAGSLCMQTHIPYLGLVGGLGLVTVVGLGVFAYRHRDQARAKGLWRWTLVALALFVVIWTPPVIDQVVHDPGNLRVIRDHFSDPPEPPIGVSRGFESLMTQINPFRLFGAELVRDGRQREVSGATFPGVLLVIAWASAVVGAWRLRHRQLMRLNVVLAAGLVLGLLSAVRIFGYVWFYLLLWAWGLAILMLFATVWTAWEYVRTRMDPPRATRWARAGAVGLAGIAVVCTGLLMGSAARVEVMSPVLNAQLGALAGPTVERLRAARDEGAQGPYLVSWLPEAQAIGAQGYGLLNELLRGGLDVKAADVFQPGATRYHVIKPEQGTLLVHLATGADIARWRADSRFQEIASYDPRSEGERALFDQLRGQVIDEFTQSGRLNLVPQVDDNLFMLVLADIPESTRQKVQAMLRMGLPAATFIGPNVDPPRLR